MRIVTSAWMALAAALLTLVPTLAYAGPSAHDHDGPPTDAEQTMIYVLNRCDEYVHGDDDPTLSSPQEGWSEETLREYYQTWIKMRQDAIRLDRTVASYTGKLGTYPNAAQKLAYCDKAFPKAVEKFIAAEKAVKADRDKREAEMRKADSEEFHKVQKEREADTLAVLKTIKGEARKQVYRDEEREPASFTGGSTWQKATRWEFTSRMTNNDFDCHTIYTFTAAGKLTGRKRVGQCT